MKYTIITTTHDRPIELLRCVGSVLSQTNTELEMIIINDSPEYDYSSFENDIDIVKAIKDHKILYIKNNVNKGKNYSCNLALKQISSAGTKSKAHNGNMDKHYIIFLDDDDWLAPNAISDIDKFIRDMHKSSCKHNWIVTNRVLEDGKSLTINNSNKSIINYFWDYLCLGSFKGDATHIIERHLATSSQFPTKVMNGEEWYYFAQLVPSFTYKSLNTTITSGYRDDGLTDKLKNKYTINTWLLWKDRMPNFSILLYMLLRTLKVIKKKYL